MSLAKGASAKRTLCSDHTRSMASRATIWTLIVGDAPGDGVKVWTWTAPARKADTASKLEANRFMEEF
jgi:hypothetical protein